MLDCVKKIVWKILFLMEFVFRKVFKISTSKESNMSAAKLNLKIDQGSTFSRGLQFTQEDKVTPIDKTGSTLRGMIRLTYDSVAPLVSFSIDETDKANGNFLFYLSAVQTASLPSTKDKDPLVYDIEEVIGSNVTRILQGAVQVSPEATK